MSFATALRVPSPRVWPWLLFVLCGSASCGRSTTAGGPPAASLATTRAAQEAFRPIKQTFANTGRAGRLALEPRLRWFVSAFPDDGQIGQARLYLALIAADRGEAAGARTELDLLAASPRGTTRDLAELVRAALALRAGEHAQAYARLSPLVGKLIDAYARNLLDEQIVAAALGTGRWYEAVAYMDLWLRDTSEQGDQVVRDQVSKSLEAVPSEALELMMQTTLRRRAPGGYGAAVRKLVVARLASVAIQEQDTQLARRLVESAAGTQALGDASDALHELAESGGAAVVEGRTIGLLLSTGTSHLGARAAEVLSGIVDALRSDGAADGVRLITRDERDPKRTELAMRSLASQGAAVIIAGLDDLQAEVARSFAERTGTPVLTLASLRQPPASAAPPSSDAARASAFALGERSDSAVPALLAALTKSGVTTCAVVGGTVPVAETSLALTEPASCHITAVQAGEPRFPVRAWRAARADCLLLLGESSCAAEALGEALQRPSAVGAVGLGLEAADLVAQALPVALWVTAAGAFPLQHGDSASPLGGYARRQGKPPTWFAALGHDAAVLARAALRALPDTRTELAVEVVRRHRAAAAALHAVRVDLWTSTARGFEAGPSLPRELVVREAR